MSKVERQSASNCRRNGVILAIFAKGTTLDKNRITTNAATFRNLCFQKSPLGGPCKHLFVLYRAHLHAFIVHCLSRMKYLFKHFYVKYFHLSQVKIALCTFYV